MKEVLSMETFPFEKQIQRIKAKLAAADQADPERKVFGASIHKYRLSPPVPAKQIHDFEQKYEVELPLCYKTFLLHVGEAGAGPFYGLYPLGRGVAECMYDPENYLKAACVMYPGITQERWKELTRVVDEDEDKGLLTEEAYDAEINKLFGGILILGTQGCTYYSGIVLTGEYRGKIVNVDDCLQLPRFCYEKNFLDWYERWLDEVISGDLFQKRNAWFGFVRGGSDQELLQYYLGTDDGLVRIQCLHGIENKSKISQEVFQCLEQEWKQSTPAVKEVLLCIYTKFHYLQAKPYLEEFSATDPLAVFSTIDFYAEEKSREWMPLIRRVAGQVNDPETFRFMGYLLAASGEDFMDVLMPFLKHPDDDIRTSAYYTMGQMKGKKQYVDQFLEGLKESEERVLLHVIQALEGVQDLRLLPAYQKIAREYLPESNIILNLSYLLKVYKLSPESIQEIDIDRFIKKQTRWNGFWTRFRKKEK